MIELLNNKYKIVSGKDNFDYDEVKTFFTDYFLPFDFVLADYAYDHIRLKGFYSSDNKKVKTINDIKYLDDYIKHYCAFGSKTFLLEKIK